MLWQSSLDKADALIEILLATSCLLLTEGAGQEGRGRGGVKGLEEQTRTIPSNLSRLEANVAKQSGRLEALHSIRPDLQMPKQLGWEVQEAKVKMKQVEKASEQLPGLTLPAQPSPTA